MLYNLHHVRQQTTTTLSLEMPQQLFRPLQQPQTLFRFLGTSITDYATALDMSGLVRHYRKEYFRYYRPRSTSMSRLNASRSSSRMQRTSVSSTAHLSQTVSTSRQLLPNTLRDEGYTEKEYTFSDSNDVAAVTQSACDASDAIYIPTDNTAASCTEGYQQCSFTG